MSALPRNWRISVNNGAAGAVQCTVRGRPFKFVAGVLTFGDEVTLLNESSISAAAWANGTAQNNSTDAWVGISLLVTSSTSTTHALWVQIQASPDAGTTWPANGGGITLGTIYRATAATLADNLRAP